MPMTSLSGLYTTHIINNSNALMHLYPKKEIIIENVWDAFNMLTSANTKLSVSIIY